MSGLRADKQCVIRPEANTVDVEWPAQSEGATTTAPVCVTIDVEEYFHIEAARQSIRSDDYFRWPTRVEPQMDMLLALFEKHGVKATLFFLGYIAKKHPKLVKRCAEAGHEIASHGSQHHRVHHLSQEQFRHDTKASKDCLEDIVGKPVLGFRAPTWSITQDTLWALDVLLELGFVYDASIFPTRHPQYGMPSAPIQPNMRDTPGGGSIAEIPPLVWQALGRNIPVAGGGYFRQFPLGLMKKGLAQAAANNRPAVLYFHPWEFDEALPQMPLPWLSRVRTYRGIRGATGRLDHVLGITQHHTTMAAVAEQLAAGDVALPRA